MAEYKMIPVDAETKKKLVVLAKAFGFGERGQGVMMRRLVNEEYEKWAAVKMLPTQDGIGSLPAVDDVA